MRQNFAKASGTSPLESLRLVGSCLGFTLHVPTFPCSTLAFFPLHFQGGSDQWPCGMLVFRGLRVSGERSLNPVFFVVLQTAGPARPRHFQVYNAIAEFSSPMFTSSRFWLCCQALWFRSPCYSVASLNKLVRLGRS